MSFKVSGFTFEGPFAFYSDVKDEPGVYVIVKAQLTEQFVIDVGESDQVRSQLNHHERENCWKEACQGLIGIGTLYLPDSTVQQRGEIAAIIRKGCAPLPCGGS